MTVGWVAYLILDSLILVIAVYKQKQVIFNQNAINRLALLTGALHPHACTYIKICLKHLISENGPGLTRSLVF